MNMNDYKNAAERIEISPELKDEIIAASTQKGIKRSFGKKRIIPVLAAVVLSCACVTAVFASDIKNIFVNHTNFEISISEAPQQEVKTIPVLNAGLKKWNEETLNHLFIDGKTIAEDNEYQSDTNPEITRRVIEFDIGGFLGWEDGEVGYRVISDYDYNHMVSVALNGNDSGANPFTRTRIEGFDSEDALKQSDRIINELGIPVSSHEIIALDYETMMKEDTARNCDGERIDKHGEILPEWTEEQDAYLIVYHADGGELPVTSHRSQAEGSEIYTVVSRRGIEEFNARWIYEKTSVNSNVEVCTAEEAAYALGNTAYKVIPRSNTIIKNCRLVYVPVPVESGKTFELRPYWEFYATEEVRWYDDNLEKTGFDKYDTKFVNAETCEVMKDTFK